MREYKIEIRNYCYDSWDTYPFVYLINGSDIFETKFTEQEFKENFTKYNEFVKICNCSCGVFECDGKYSKITEDKDYFYLNAIYNLDQLKESDLSIKINKIFLK